MSLEHFIVTEKFKSNLLHYPPPEKKPHKDEGVFSDAQEPTEQSSIAKAGI